MKVLNHKVSWQVVDAWKATPPCNPDKENPYCHVQCPHFDDCYPEEDEEDEEWPEEDRDIDPNNYGVS